MDQQQREQAAAQIRAERERRGWPQSELARRAHVAPNTVSAIENAKNVQPGSLGKIMEALEIEPLSEAVARSESPQDVHLVLEVLRMWLLGMPAEDRPEAVYRLLRFLSGQPAK